MEVKWQVENILTATANEIGKNIYF